MSQFYVETYDLWNSPGRHWISSGDLSSSLTSKFC